MCACSCYTEFITKITLLNQVGIPRYFMRKLQGQTTLKLQSCDYALVGLVFISYSKVWVFFLYLPCEFAAIWLYSYGTMHRFAAGWVR